MAAPADKTLKNLSGKWVMNKKLSDDTDSILAMQGVGWLTRKAIALATIILTVKEYVDDNGNTHIDIDQAATGSKGTREERTLNWQESEHTDYIFGKVRGKSRWVKLDELDDDFLKNGWLPEIKETEVIQTQATSVDKGWVAIQTWGFQEIEGKRRYVRHTVVTKGSQRKIAYLVYDYQGE